jgi:hypothetical protein
MEQREPSKQSQVADVEPGWLARSALARVRTARLRDIMDRASFHAVAEQDVVPVAPCPFCLDGGLRVAGTVRARNAKRLVRVCDTCGEVDLTGGPPHQTDSAS